MNSFPRVSISPTAKLFYAAALLVMLTPTPSLDALSPSEKIDFGKHDIPSVFHIAKSQNRNQVHYGLRVDERCRPLGEEPVFGYWRELEKGPEVVSRLLGHERPAYGIREQWVEARVSTAGRVKLRLEVLPDRVVAVESYRTGRKGCEARSVMRIERQPCILKSVYVKLGALFGVESITLIAEQLQGGGAVRELIRP